MNDDMFRPPRVFAGEHSKITTLDEAKVVILPVPYDSTTEYKGGTREGPQAIIDASQYLELYDIELDRDISEIGIHTLPEVQPLMSGPDSMVERVQRVTADLLDKHKLPVMLGGEHTVTLGTVKALRERYPELSVLYLDAHGDLRDEYMGTKYSHACVMRRVWGLCPIMPVGLRSISQEEHDFLEHNGIEPLYAEAFNSPGSIQNVVSRLSPHVYISIDLDVLDPSIMSAVGTPEPGGLNWQQVLELLRAVAERKHIVGFDLVELCPAEGPNSCAFLAAKLAYKLIGYATSSI
ncbi:MAG TPA: agmatinase [Dehalococcoidia bacterium]|nr:agmatinase [Dehalococcoidia bacterium]